MSPFGTPRLFGYLEEDDRNDDDELASHQIFEGGELLVGRDHKTCNVILTDLTISKQHVQIYTVAYDEENHQRSFVYAKDLSTNGSYWRYKHGNNWKESLIGKGCAVLLSDGDKVRLCNGSSFAFRSICPSPELSEDASMSQEEDAKLFNNIFSITDRKIGSGAYGEVLMAVDRARKRQMACKVVKLGKSPLQQLGTVNLSQSLWREVELLKDISHPNIIHVERVFFTERFLFIISDLITGGDLMSYMERPCTKIDDAEARIIVYQILKALEYLHEHAICHRDVKPENILMSTPARGARVILADFGHSTKLNGGRQIRSRRMKTATVGTDYYVAPEVRGKNKKAEGYTMAADMWSTGIITTLLLTGESVFEKSRNKCSAEAVLDAAAECDLAKIDHNSLWRTVSDLGKEFVKGLLVLDELTRLEVGQALKHEWFTHGEREETIVQEYEEAIRTWVPSRPLLDFKEDLNLFREASKSPLDSALMPPPARPISNRSLFRPLHGPESDQESSPFFSRATQDGARKIAAQACRKRELESDDDASTASISSKQAAPADKRQTMDNEEKCSIQTESKTSAKSSAKQDLGVKDETLFPGEVTQETQRPITDLEYEERKLYDRVSREEASIFRSAKFYGQAVEKKRRLLAPASAMGPSILTALV